MHDGIETIGQKKPGKAVAIASIANHQRDAIRQRTAVAARKIIQHGDAVTVLQQKSNGRAADITCAPRHKHVFCHLLHRAKGVLLKGRYDVRRTERSKEHSKHNARWMNDAGIPGLIDGKRIAPCTKPSASFKAKVHRNQYAGTSILTLLPSDVFCSGLTYGEGASTLP